MMNMNKILFLLLLTTPAIASTPHETLADAVKSTGIRIIVNTPEYCKDNAGGGAYIPMKKELHICQQNGSTHHVEVDYTEEDLNTLRHEAHHIVQDCLDGSIDARLKNLFDTEDTLTSFVSSSLSYKEVTRIIKTYKEGGADDHVIRLELEAFAVAEDVSPESIANAIIKHCPIVTQRPVYVL